MSESGYPAARVAAHKIHSHFSGLHALHAEAAPVPEPDTIETLIDAAFWASLQREEGYVPRVSLAFFPLEQASGRLQFERPLTLSSPALTRLAPAVERPGIHLGVMHREGNLLIWGASRKLPANCFVVEVVAPGLLVVKHSRGAEPGKFVNVAVLQGDQIKIIDQKAATMPDCPELLTSLLGLDSQFEAHEQVNVLIQLAVSMRAHARGGLMLVVPAGSESWRESVLQPITYSVSPAFTALEELLRQKPESRPDGQWNDALRRLVDGIAGLTAVDGATVISDSYHLLAFGAKIVRRKGSAQVSQVIVTEPAEGTSAETVEPAQLGGTRHLSAAQFVHDQKDAIAMVASQDGRFTMFGWSPCEGMVHAHRVEILLL